MFSRLTLDGCLIYQDLKEIIDLCLSLPVLARDYVLNKEVSRIVRRIGCSCTGHFSLKFYGFVILHRSEVDLGRRGRGPRPRPNIKFLGEERNRRGRGSKRQLMIFGRLD